MTRAGNPAFFLTASSVSVFAYMVEVARVLENKKTGNSTLESLVAGRVERDGEISNFFRADLVAFEQVIGQRFL